MAKNKALHIGHLAIHPGERITLALPAPELYSCAPMHIPVHVMHGKKAGPVLILAATTYGDEVNGIAIIQKLLELNLLKSLHGTLIALPVLNIYSLAMSGSTISEKTNLEHSFPGDAHSSLPSRLAHILSKEILSLGTHCIDLRGGEPFVKKMPQVHTELSFGQNEELAIAFRAPIVVDRNTPKGLLWMTHQTPSIPTILFETGEAMRLDPEGIRLGTQGIIRVMRCLNMLPSSKLTPDSAHTQVVRSSTWLRSPLSGLAQFFKKPGDRVKKGTLLAKITDPFGKKHIEEILAPFEGILLSQKKFPLMHEGTLLAEVGQTEKITSLSQESSS